jgi:hypothetical protein
VGACPSTGSLCTYPLNAGVAVRLVGTLSLRLLKPIGLNPLDEGKPKFWDNCRVLPPWS